MRPFISDSRPPCPAMFHTACSRFHTACSRRSFLFREQFYRRQNGQIKRRQCLFFRGIVRMTVDSRARRNRSAKDRVGHSFRIVAEGGSFSLTTTTATFLNIYEGARRLARSSLSNALNSNARQ